jgi:hypothetical protein
MLYPAVNNTHPQPTKNCVDVVDLLDIERENFLSFLAGGMRNNNHRREERYVQIKFEMNKKPRQMCLSSVYLHTLLS